VLSHDHDLFAHVRALFAVDARFVVSEDLVHCDGRTAPLTNIYPTQTEASEWADWESETLPSPADCSQLIFETRDSEWVAEVGARLAEGLIEAVWLVDSADALWPAAQVDASKVALA
jgi:hypothetical protein